jgi:hypothetical protein
LSVVEAVVVPVGEVEVNALYELLPPDGMVVLLPEPIKVNPAGIVGMFDPAKSNAEAIHQLLLSGGVTDAKVKVLPEATKVTSPFEGTGASPPLNANICPPIGTTEPWLL